MKIAIFYFSGTGNTETVACFFQSEFKLQGSGADLYPIDVILNENREVDYDSYDIFGIGYPIHAFDAPEIVYKFIKRLLPVKKRMFLFKVPADPIGNGGSSFFIRRSLKKKGYTVFHESIFIMRSNIAVKFPDNLVKQLYLSAKKRAAAACREVLDGKMLFLPDNPLKVLFSWLFNRAERWGSHYFGMLIQVKEGCILCNKCVKNCPAQNITRDKDKIKFKKHCLFCMRCFYNCPVNAIKPGFIKFIALKEWYEDYTVILKNKSLDGKYVTRETKGYFSHFYKYIKRTEDPL